MYELSLPMLLKDGYKVGHPFQYPVHTETVYSNLTPRGSRIPGVRHAISWGFQAFVLEYLVKQFQERFFALPKREVIRRYARRINNYLGPIDTYHIEALHDLGYLPLHVKAIPEGTPVPMRVPLLTLYNTDTRFGWLTNSLETLLSLATWQGVTAATIANEYRKNFDAYARKTGASLEFCQWQGHDFSMRGLSGIDATGFVGGGHLLSFTGSDTIPAIDFLEEFYQADCERELIAGSVPATEHSVMCAGEQVHELETFRRLIQDVYPAGIVSIVSDTWDFWKVMTEFTVQLKDVILQRNGKVVFRPDSGDPVKIICGDPQGTTEAERAGAIEVLWNIFGGRVNEKGFRELDPHVGLIYGDSITLDRQQAILAGLLAKGFASSNVVLGVGSYTYQYVTRDTLGLAMKATWVQIEGKGYAISKKPRTDNGLKNSASGLLSVERNPETHELELVENLKDFNDTRAGELQSIFLNGAVRNQESLSTIRQRLAAFRELGTLS